MSPETPAGAARRRHLLVASCVAAAVAVCIGFLDRPAALWAHGLSPGVVAVFAAITVLGSSVPYLAATAVLAPLLHWGLRRPQAARRALFVFTAVAAAGLATDLAKVVFGRWRPLALFGPKAHYGFALFHHGYRHNSFPSGHASTAGALACALALLFPRWRALWFTVAAVAAASRVIVGSHYPADVVAGFWVGVVVTLAVAGSRWFRAALGGAGGSSHGGGGV